MTTFADLADLPEEERILLMRQRVDGGETVGFFVENNANADRYIARLGPTVRVISRGKIRGAVFVKIGPPLQH